MERQLELSGNGPLADQLVAAFGTMLSEARGQAKAAAEGPGPALHDYRRAVRRAEAVLDLTRPMLRKYPRNIIAAGLSRATRKTRTLRDLDAVRPSLAKLAEAELDPRYADALAALKRYLEAAAAELAGTEITAWRLRKNVRALAGLDDAFRAGLHNWVEPEMLLDRLRVHYKDVRNAYRQARESLTVGDLHAWRKAARTVRYQLELLKTTGDPALERLHVTFEKQVRQLGAVTDLVALAGIVADADPELLGVDPEPLVESLEGLVDQRATTAFLDAEITFMTKPKAFAVPVALAPVAEAHTTNPNPDTTGT